MRYTYRTDGTSWKTIRKIVKFSGSQINAIYKIITSKNKNSIEIISTWWFLFWLFLTVFQSLIFLHSFVYTNVYIFYVCDCFHLAAYFSFSFLFAFVICCVRAFFVGRGRGGALHWFYVVLVADERNSILLCWDYHFYLYSFKKTIMAIPWISHISVLYIFIALFVRTII